MTPTLTTDVLPAYRDYLDACNARDWSTAVSFVHDPVRVQGVVTSAAAYVAGIARLTAEHPGFVWTVGETVLEGRRLAVRLCTPLGPEYAIYTWRDGRIAEYWGR
ncbi:MAG TPA: nuclear transport factor 2 family protein [Pseudolysinimonas sp.]|jgi:predicted ester cyclase